MAEDTDQKNYRITLYIDTPKPLLRPFKDFTKHNQIESLLTSNSLDPVAITGHAFIGLTDKNGKEERWGYTCKEPRLFKAICGMSGEMEKEDHNSPYNEAIIWNISKEQYLAANKVIEELKENPGTYKLFEKNCASVATSILKAADVPDIPEGKMGLSPYGLALKKRVMLAQRRAETIKFKIRNTLNSLFGKEKAPNAALLDSLRSKPVPVPINNAMKAFKEDRKNNRTSPLDFNRVIASISNIRSAK